MKCEQILIKIHHFLDSWRDFVGQNFLQPPSERGTCGIVLIVIAEGTLRPWDFATNFSILAHLFWISQRFWRRLLHFSSTAVIFWVERSCITRYDANLNQNYFKKFEWRKNSNFGAIFRNFAPCGRKILKNRPEIRNLKMFFNVIRKGGGVTASRVPGMMEWHAALVDIDVHKVVGDFKPVVGADAQRQTELRN